MKIDIHSHIIPRSCVSSDKNGLSPYIIEDDLGNEALFDYRRIAMAIDVREMCDPEIRIKKMEKQQVDIQILSAPPSLMYYNLDSNDSLRFLKKMNDGIAKIVEKFPKKFLGLASIPLQNSKIAVHELNRSVEELGLSGIEILSNINGISLDDESLYAFYSEVQKYNLPILIHPYNVAGADRMKNYYLANLIGNPLDTALAAANIIFGGILDKFPNLRFILSHAGGVLPFIIGRWDHGFTVRKEAKKNIIQKPSNYLKNFYFDTITHSNTALEFLIEEVGADNVVMGTDFPFDMADDKPVKTVEQLKVVYESDKEKIIGRNAEKLFKIK